MQVSEYVTLLTSTEAILPPWRGPVALLVLGGAVVVAMCWVWWSRHSQAADSRASGERDPSWWVMAHAAVLVGWLALVYLFAGVGLVFGAGPGLWTLLLSSAVSLGVVLALLRPFESIRRAVLITSAVGIVTVVSATLIAGAFFDLSWDGQFYHQEAVLQIDEGWNPVHDPAAGSMVWVTHYPKAAWYQAAAIVATTGRIETGKAPGLLLAAVSVSLVFVMISEGLPRIRRWAPPVALLVAPGPIAAVQWATFYADGMLAALLLLMLSAAVIACLRPDLWRPCLAVAVASSVLATGVKLTGAIYVAILIVGIAPAFWRRAPAGGATRRAALGALAIVVAGSLIAGYNPYLTNLRLAGNPFYPVLGPGAIDVTGAQADTGFLERGPVGRFVVSHASASGDRIRPKSPLAVGWPELVAMGAADTRHGGFGPLSAASFLASCACAPVLLRRYRSLSLDGRRLATWAVPAVAVSVAVNPAAWWARYVPQAWFLVPAAALIALDSALADRRRGGLGVVVAALAVALVVANGVLVSGPNVASQVIGTEQVLHVHHELRGLLSAEGLVLEVDPQGHRAGLRRLDEAGIAHAVVDLEADEGGPLPGSLVTARIR